jgi:hypothetical protein
MSVPRIPQFVVAIKNVSIAKEVIVVRRSVCRDTHVMTIVIVKVCTV